VSSTAGEVSWTLAQFDSLGTVLLAPGTALALSGTPVNDTFSFVRQTFGADDRIDGGDGTADTLRLKGSGYSSLHLGADSLSGVERISFIGGFNYTVTSDGGNVDHDQRMLVIGSRLGALDSLVFDGSAENDGSFDFRGGAGTSTFTGSSGVDKITAGAGADTIRYTQNSQSVATTYLGGYDTVSGFDGSLGKDSFGLATAVTFDPALLGGPLSKASFNHDLEAAAGALEHDHAALFTATGGNLDGATFLLVHTGSGVGYHGGTDLLVKLDNAVAISQDSFKTL
jgi:hypothetical protein